MRCCIDTERRYYPAGVGPREDDRFTPAVAITVEAYNEVRARLADMAANALHAHERDWTRDTLAMLPEVPT